MRRFWQAIFGGGQGDDGDNGDQAEEQQRMAAEIQRIFQEGIPQLENQPEAIGPLLQMMGIQPKPKDPAHLSGQDLLNDQLFEAARAGNLPEFKSLLSKGANIKMKKYCPKKPGEALLPQKIKTPLQVASSKGHYHIVKFILETDLSTVDDLNQDTNRGALHFACGKKSSAQVVELLLNVGKMNPNLKALGDWTPVHDAVAVGRLDLVQVLEKHGGDLHAETDSGANTISIAACSKNYDLVKWLLDKGVSPNCQDKSGLTSLHRLARFGDLGMVKLLVDYGHADVNILDKSGCSAMEEADRNNMNEISSYLYTRGCTLSSIKNPNGNVGPISWIRFRHINLPSTRYGCGLASIGSKVVLFGGLGLQGNDINHDNENHMQDHQKTAALRDTFIADISKVQARSMIPLVAAPNQGEKSNENTGEASSSSIAADDSTTASSTTPTPLQSTILGFGAVLRPKATPPSSTSATPSASTPAPKLPFATAPAQVHRPEIILDCNHAGNFLVIDEDGLGGRSRPHRHQTLRASIVRATIPFTKEDAIGYFELHVIDGGDQRILTIGLVDEHYPVDDKQPGWASDSYGYHGDDGGCFHNHGAGKAWAERFNPGDIIGCGIIFPSASTQSENASYSSPGEVFWTKNGRFLGVSHYGPQADKYYGVIGVENDGAKFRVNFGKSPFKFNFMAQTLTWVQVPLQEEYSTTRGRLVAMPEVDEILAIPDLRNGLMLKVWIFNLRSAKWRSHNCVGERPIILTNSQIVRCGDAVYVWNLNEACQEEKAMVSLVALLRSPSLYKLDLEYWEWKEMLRYKPENDNTIDDQLNKIGDEEEEEESKDAEDGGNGSDDDDDDDRHIHQQIQLDEQERTANEVAAARLRAINGGNNNNNPHHAAAGGAADASNNAVVDTGMTVAAEDPYNGEEYQHYFRAEKKEMDAETIGNVKRNLRTSYTLPRPKASSPNPSSSGGIGGTSSSKIGEQTSSSNNGDGSNNNNNNNSNNNDGDDEVEGVDGKKRKLTPKEKMIRSWYQLCSLLDGDFKNATLVSLSKDGISTAPQDQELVWFTGSEILRVNPNDWSFKTDKISGNRPLITHHSSTSVGNDIVTFGGWDDRKQQNELFVLDTRELLWYKPHIVGQLFPRPRNNHTCILYETSDPSFAIDPNDDMDTTIIAPHTPKLSINLTSSSSLISQSSLVTSSTISSSNSSSSYITNKQPSSFKSSSLKKSRKSAASSTTPRNVPATYRFCIFAMGWNGSNTMNDIDFVALDTRKKIEEMGVLVSSNMLPSAYSLESTKSASSSSSNPFESTIPNPSIAVEFDMVLQLCKEENDDNDSPTSDETSSQSSSTTQSTQTTQTSLTSEDGSSKPQKSKSRNSHLSSYALGAHQSVLWARSSYFQKIISEWNGYHLSEANSNKEEGISSSGNNQGKNESSSFSSSQPSSSPPTPIRKGVFVHVMKGGVKVDHLQALLNFLYTDSIDVMPILSDYREFIKMAEIYAPEHVTRLVAEYLHTKVYEPERLNEQLAYLLTTSFGFDTCFELNGTLFRAHKSVLCPRSPYFKALLTGGMSESSQSVIKIEDDGVEAPAFEAFLKWIYSRSIDYDALSEYILPLFTLASKYEEKRLKIILENVIAFNLDHSNVVSLLFLADAHNAQSLKKACIRFIQQASSSQEELDYGEWTNHDVQQVIRDHLLSGSE